MVIKHLDEKGDLSKASGYINVFNILMPICEGQILFTLISQKAHEFIRGMNGVDKLLSYFAL